MKVDMSRYQECPNCHTFQGNLMPCRKCGYHITYQEIVPIPTNRSYHAVITRPGPKPKSSYKCRELALLRALQDGDWHPVADLRKKGVIPRWAPKFFVWQAHLEDAEIIGYDKIPTRSKRFCVRIVPDRMQDARKLMAQLEDVEDGED